MVVVLFPRFRTPAWRPFRAFMFVAMGLSALFPVLHGVKTFGAAQMERQMGLSWLVTQGVLYILGAGIYAVSGKWPCDDRSPGRARWSRDWRIREADLFSLAGSNPGAIGAGFFRYLGELAPDFPCAGRDGCWRTSGRLVESF
jgi:hypothetical protein